MAFLCKIKVLNSLVQQLWVNLVQADHKLVARRPESWLISAFLHRFRQQIQTLSVKIRLVTQDYTELLDQQLQRIVEPDQYLLSVLFFVVCSY